MMPSPIRLLLRVISAIWKGVLVDVDDVVQEADGGLDNSGEAFPIEGLRLLWIEKIRDINRPEIAGFVRVQGLFAAGVRCPDRPELPGGVQPVYPVDEDEPRVAHGPGRFDEQPEDVAGLFCPVFLRADGSRIA